MSARIDRGNDWQALRQLVCADGTAKFGDPVDGALVETWPEA
ncbi:hypothetical protein [Rubripirellula lacrimiformis]|nr:hypothetical protein [Rubripirellula lacrimiformis]